VVALKEPEFFNVSAVRQMNTGILQEIFNRVFQAITMPI
jgi:hypothetical protein